MNKKLLTIALVAIFSVSFLFGPALAQEYDIGIAFSINLLSPNTSPARDQWSLLMEQTLPKIGIGVTFHESTGWGNIGPRTWDYPFLDEYTYIPTYAQGGYDILFVGWSWGLDLNLQGLYETTGITPYGDNHYQYSNPTYDALLEDFMETIPLTERFAIGSDLQEILYEDQPVIALVYPRSLFGFKTGLTGIDGLLIDSSGHRAEYWDDPVDHIIKYAIPADLRENNPWSASSYYDFQWIQAVYGALVQREQANYGWVPQIAENLTISMIGDDMNMTVFLDPLAKFSDGEPVLPSDVKYSMELIMTPAVGDGNYGTYTYWFESNDSVSIVGPDVAGGQLLYEMTGVFNLADSLLNYYIIDKTKADNTGVEDLIGLWGYDIFGDVPGEGHALYHLVKSCGPFIVEDYDGVNSVVKMVPNPHYLGATPKLTEFYLTFVSGKDTAISSLISGAVDIVDGQYFPTYDDFTGQTGIEGVLVKAPNHQEMGVNMKHPIMGTGDLTPLGTADAAKYIRQAISHAVPRDIIVDEILEGLGAPATTAVPDSVLGYDDTLVPYAYDLETARDLMEDAGYTIRTPITPTGITGLLFISFLGLASLLAFRRFKK